MLALSALGFVGSRGYTLYYGDAEAHLNHARRIVDSRTPGPDELGNVWLPLPHLRMIPFVKNDALWRSGWAGAIPWGACFVLSGVLLFAASGNRVFGLRDQNRRMDNGVFRRRLLAESRPARSHSAALGLT